MRPGVTADAASAVDAADAAAETVAIVARVVASVKDAVSAKDAVSVTARAKVRATRPAARHGAMMAAAADARVGMVATIAANASRALGRPHVPRREAKPMEDAHRVLRASHASHASRVNRVSRVRKLSPNLLHRSTSSTRFRSMRRPRPAKANATVVVGAVAAGVADAMKAVASSRAPLPPWTSRCLPKPRMHQPPNRSLAATRRGASAATSA